MSDAPSNPVEQWRNYEKRTSVAACELRREDLKRLYRLINEKQIEVGTRLRSGFFQTAAETPEQFKVRRARVQDAFITTVTITGANGEVVTGHGEAFFDSALLPERITTILYDTSFSAKAILEYTPADRASVLLDFSRPALLAFDAQPSEPTPNNSNWMVTAQTESWSTALSTRLKDFFAVRATQVDWLHRSSTYDALVLIVVSLLGFGELIGWAILSSKGGIFILH